MNRNYGTEEDQYQQLDSAEAINVENEDKQPEEDDGMKAQDEVDKQRMEKVFRKQEEDWICKRDKVSRVKLVRLVK